MVDILQTRGAVVTCENALKLLDAMTNEKELCAMEVKGAESYRAYPFGFYLSSMMQGNSELDAWSEAWRRCGYRRPIVGLEFCLELGQRCFIFTSVYWSLLTVGCVKDDLRLRLDWVGNKKDERKDAWKRGGNGNDVYIGERFFSLLSVGPRPRLIRSSGAWGNKGKERLKLSPDPYLILFLATYSW